MFGGLLSIKGLAIASGLALVAGGFAGWQARDAFCDAAQAKEQLAHARAQIALLNDRIKTVESINAAHQKRLEADTAAAEANEGAVDDVPKNTSACLMRDVAERLRKVR